MRMSSNHNAGPRGDAQPSQAGFSMIEMLMTAFILAIGILGLSMLQVMSLRASRGSRSLTTAVQVGEAVMDQIEMEGRLSWLNITDTKHSPPTALAGLKYVNTVAGSVLIPATPPDTFNIKGETPHASPDPGDALTYFTVTTTTIPGNQESFPYLSPQTGLPVAIEQLDDFIVRVDFSDVVNPTTNVAVPRSATLFRRILHGVPAG